MAVIPIRCSPSPTTPPSTPRLSCIPLPPVEASVDYSPRQELVGPLVNALGLYVLCRFRVAFEHDRSSCLWKSSFKFYAEYRFNISRPGSTCSQ
ncbi:hypothetical protein M422DRAFT_35161 [Sphaerobolus stellatus SS14]|uniref:Uncharacterized protein n=1 Tax=Sphaerobolus stellatus (strain SS14) TaxID=990650 RepID=A0A0C9U182_SPHS4|nr:hypothetical protein M422DRAFT_37609 [Sphaerobolus stellatus SS14]KIJ34329.1 hypothetical protein M422DRAFT_35161 [Sphaerobolus stellatus SS14]